QTPRRASRRECAPRIRAAAGSGAAAAAIAQCGTATVIQRLYTLPNPRLPGTSSQRKPAVPQRVSNRSVSGWLRRPPHSNGGAFSQLLLTTICPRSEEKDIAVGPSPYAT